MVGLLGDRQVLDQHGFVSVVLTVQDHQHDGCLNIFTFPTENLKPRIIIPTIILPKTGLQNSRLRFSYQKKTWN